MVMLQGGSRSVGMSLLCSMNRLYCPHTMQSVNSQCPKNRQFNAHYKILYFQNAIHYLLSAGYLYCTAAYLLLFCKVHNYQNCILLIELRNCPVLSCCEFDSCPLFRL